jgi:hypothetical protein
MQDSRVVRIGAWTVALVGSGLLVRGIAVEVLLAADIGGIHAAVGPLQTRWSLILWNPWFVLGGALLVATATRVLRRAHVARSSR